jgi:hypothetical protein
MGGAMALKKKGEWWHASTAEDLDQYLLRHVLGRHRRGVPHRVTHARCKECAAARFDLFIDRRQRILRVCTACESEHKICDLDRKCDVDSAGEIVCDCMYSGCEVAIGFALKHPSEREEGPVAYLYVAGRCTECGLCGVYSEWSPEGDFSFAELAESV